MPEMLLEKVSPGFKKLEAVVHRLAKLLVQRNLFPATHPSVKVALDSSMEALDALLDGRTSVVLRTGNGSVRLLNLEVDITESEDNAVHYLRKALDTMSIGEIEFLSGTSPDEVLALAEIASASLRRDESKDLPSIWRRIQHIHIRHSSGKANMVRPESRLPVKVSSRDVESLGGPGTREDSAASRMISGVVSRLAKIGSEDSGRAGRMLIDAVARDGISSTNFLLLKSLKEYDDYTFNHSINVAVISAAIAGRLGFGEEETERIGTAALLHDIGKLYVPRDILHKAGRLSPAEWQKVKRHPVDGERILREEGVDRLACRVAYEHHMRYDLKGYPMPAQGLTCHEFSDIVRIADTYDALTTKRSYRRQISPFEAMKLMEKGRGSEFHPEYLDVFLGTMGNVPIGSVLVLESGAHALVLEARSGGRLPLARIVTDKYGNEIEDGPVIDLAEKDEGGVDMKYRVASILESPVRDVEIGKYVTNVKK